MTEVLKFWAPWCGPCKVLSMNLEGLEVTNINIDEDVAGMAKEYKIRNVPTLIYLKDGAEIYRTAGIITREEFLSMVNLLENGE